MKFKVISGGQTGIDILGVQLANKYGIPTGGTIGFDNNGYKIEYDDNINRDLFNFTKTSNTYYPYRTEQNVINSDGTVYFASDLNSRGLGATRRYAQIHNKPFLLNPMTSEDINNFINTNKINTLNIAGNRGSALSEEMRNNTTNILNEVFKDLGSKQFNEIPIIFDDILNADTDFVMQQVNGRGVMGAGLAKQIRQDISDNDFNKYKNFVLQNGENSLGYVIPTKSISNPNRYYLNVVGQYDYGRDKQYTDYNALVKAFDKINDKFPNKSIAIPYGMGAGLGGGNWEEIDKLIANHLFNMKLKYYKK